jgi:hypothetical protein
MTALNAMGWPQWPSLDRLATVGRCPTHRARLYTVLGCALGLSAAATVLVLSYTGLSVAVGEFGRFVAMGLGMLVLALFCNARHDDKRLAETAAIVGLLTLSLVLCGLLSNAGLRLRMPLMDATLAWADGLAGLHVDRMIRAVAIWDGVPGLLNLFYYSAGPGFAALLCWNLFRNRADRAWEIAATTAVAMQVVAMVSIFTPARGAMIYFDLAGLDGLPAGAGTYFVDAFDRYYFGAEALLSLDRMSGVVAFPSFHAVLALVIAQSLNPTRLRLAGYVWAAMIIASAVPMGGHFVSDLVAGAGVWLAAASLVLRAMATSGVARTY